MVSKSPQGPQPTEDKDKKSPEEALEEAIRYKENYGQGCAPFMAKFYRKVHDVLGWAGLRGSTFEESIQSFFGVDPELLNDGTEQLTTDKETRLAREKARRAAFLEKMKKDEVLRKAARGRGEEFYEDSAGVRRRVGSETREQKAVDPKRVMALKRKEVGPANVKAGVIGSGKRDEDIFGKRRDPKEVFHEEDGPASVDYVGQITSDQNEVVTPPEKVYPGFSVYYRDPDHLDKIIEKLKVSDAEQVPEHLRERGFYVNTDFIDQEEGSLGASALEAKKATIKEASGNLGLMDRLTSNDLFNEKLIKSLRVELKVFEYLCLRLFKSKPSVDRRYRYKIDEFIQSVYQLISIVQSDSLCATNFQLYSVFENFILTLIEFRRDTLPEVEGDLGPELVAMFNSQLIKGLISKRKDIRGRVANDIELVGIFTQVEEMAMRLTVRSNQNMKLYTAEQRGDYTQIQATIPRFSFEVPSEGNRSEKVVLPGEKKITEEVPVKKAEGDTVHIDDNKLVAKFVEDTMITIRFQADNSDPSIEFTEVTEGKPRASAIYISPAMVQQTGIAMPSLDIDPAALANFKIGPPEDLEEPSIPGADNYGFIDLDEDPLKP